ncbi:thiamine phosphate synthase, partial [Flavobacterium circumlabens]
NPSSIANEISIIDSLFEEGLSLLHIRKPDFSELEMALFIHQIKLRFRANLVLHSHHELAQDFGINRIHFPEKQRKEVFEIARENKIISTSVHSIETFNA